MGMPAGDIAAPRPREILRLLAPFPGRAAITARVALIGMLTALVAVTCGTPEAAISVYVVFFLNRPDRVTSVVIAFALLLLVTLVIGLMLVIANACVDVIPLRVACMAVLSVALLFVTSASKLRPVGAVLALIVGFGLDELGMAPFGEAATRGLLYAWLMVAIPAGVALVTNLVLAPSPRRLAVVQLATRLRLAAKRLAGEATEAECAAFEACLYEGDQQIVIWLRLAKVEGSASMADVAALRQAAASTTAILLTVDFIARQAALSGEVLPAALVRVLTDTLTQMADMLAAGGYPVEITLDLPQFDLSEPTDLAPQVACALAALREAMEGFAVPPASEPTAPPKSGFFEADAWTNPDHIRYALKATAAAMFCYVLYQQLNWPGIHTCLITCYIVSLGTTAETVEKLTLRIAGCLAGALLGTLVLIWVIPLLTSVQALMALVLAGTGLATWVAMGSPRISYAGMQFAFAFLLCVLQGSGPGFDLTLARDRVIGILLGNLVVYFVFTRVWPVSIAKRIEATLAALVEQWTRIAQTVDAAARQRLVAGALVQYHAVRQDLGLVHYEPWWVRPTPAWVASRRQRLAELGDLSAPLYLAAGQASAETWLGQAEARLEGLAEAVRPPARLAWEQNGSG